MLCPDLLWYISVHAIDCFVSVPVTVLSIYKRPVVGNADIIFPMKGWKGMVDWARSSEDRVIIPKTILSTGKPGGTPPLPTLKDSWTWGQLMEMHLQMNITGAKVSHYFEMDSMYLVFGLLITYQRPLTFYPPLTGIAAAGTIEHNHANN